MRLFRNLGLHRRSISLHRRSTTGLERHRIRYWSWWGTMPRAWKKNMLSDGVVVLSCSFYFIPSVLARCSLDWWWVRTYPSNKNNYHLLISNCGKLSHLLTGLSEGKRDPGKGHCCDLGLCLLLRQPCYPPFDGPVALRPTPYRLFAFSQYDILGAQALPITYAIVAPDLIVIIT